MSSKAIETVMAEGRGGVWYLPAHKPPKDIQKLARAAGLASFHFDGKNIKRKEQLLNAAATAMDFPKGFGHNWDALEDYLTDLEWVDGDGYVIYYDHIDGLLEAHPDQFETLVEIFRDAVTSWKEDGETMIVFLSGSNAPEGVEKLTA